MLLFVIDVFLSVLLLALLLFRLFSVFVSSLLILDRDLTTMSVADRHRLVNWLYDVRLGNAVI